MKDYTLEEQGDERLEMMHGERAHQSAEKQREESAMLF
jgi:hypothetical protein